MADRDYEIIVRKGDTLQRLEFYTVTEAFLSARNLETEGWTVEVWPRRTSKPENEFVEWLDGLWEVA